MHIGIDMGGTKIAGALVNDGEFVKETRQLTEADQGQEHILGQLRKVIDELAQGAHVTGVGIGVPGISTGTKIVNLPHVQALNGLDLATIFDGKVAVQNDASCFALGEYTYGAGAKSKNLIGIIIGTGLGSGFVLNGKVYGGSHGHAGEAGHQLYDLNLQEYKEGQGFGDWEELLRGPKILELDKKLGGLDERPSQVWESESEVHLQVRTEVAHLLTVFLANLILIFDPDCIVLGGGVANQVLVDDVNALLPKFDCQPIVKLGILREKAAILGAVAALED